MIKKSLVSIFLSISLFANSEIDQAADKVKMQEQIKVYEEAALKDDSDAFFQLGKIYFDGVYVQNDYEKALKYFNASYYLGNINGTYNLALFYLSKKTKYHDAKKSLSLFLELARKGHAPSQNRVGMFLTAGIVLDIDYKEAVKWYEHSSKQGYVNAQCNLAYMYASGQGVWQNLGRAHAFAKPGFKKGNKLCEKVWNDFNLEKYPEDKGFKFKFYNEP